MCTWAVVYLEKTKTLQAKNFIPLSIAMIADVFIVYYIASAIAGRAL